MVAIVVAFAAAPAHGKLAVGRGIELAAGGCWQEMLAPPMPTNTDSTEFSGVAGTGQTDVHAMVRAGVTYLNMAWR